jgi:DNA-binding response OmpR family regulator
MTFLVAEEESQAAHSILYSIQMCWPGCRVLTATSGSDTLAQFTREHPDAVVLDAHIGAPDGFDVCRYLRESSDVPIIMVSAGESLLDMIRSLDLGADDYLARPFDHLELSARMRAVLRRSGMRSLDGASEYVCGDLAIDFRLRQVRSHGQEVRLTSTEFRLLEVLVRNAGITLPHHVLLDRVWGSEWSGEPGYIKVFVRRLRKKLNDDADRPRYIQTVWGTGYRFLAAPP